MGVLTVADTLALALLCRSFSDYRRASDAIEKEGEVITTATKARKVNPWVVVRNRAADDLQRGLSAFGLTPADRSRVAAVTETEQDPIDRLIAAGTARREQKERHPTKETVTCK
jgi:P27 family predicted phage terminase small subunit